MTYHWSQMTNAEKNLLVARDVLKFNCFDTKEGVNWYRKHYDLGQWRYCTRLSDAIDLSERILKDISINFQILISKDKYECTLVRPNEDSPPLFKIEGSTLPEVICLAALYLKDIEVN
ncbi:BC1872 family protein [Lysinibacillus xylanilyticus]|uniref:Phage ABA sandwich domain-containing protein n=1 Tax=Lysinibacillus xylanilyticus TaxID=582475 RepID=A0ABV3W581_9BACI